MRRTPSAKRPHECVQTMLERPEETTATAVMSGTAQPDGRHAHPIRVVIAGLGHPLSLLILGSLLTYIIAPVVVYRINQRALRQDATQKKALKARPHNTEI